MGFQQAVRTCFGKYITFEGRAPRSEYWWWVLFVSLGNLVSGLIDGAVLGYEANDGALFSVLFMLATLAPSLAVTARRLHDGGRSGWLQIAPYGLLILAGIMAGTGAMILFSAAGIAAMVLAVLLLVWLIRRGEAGPNRFGPDPLGGAAAPPDSGSYHRSRIPRVERDD